MAGKGGSLGELYFSITGEDRLEEILRKDKKLAEEVAKIAGGIQIGRTRVTQEAAKAIVAEANAQEKVAQSKLKTAQYEEKVAIASSNRLAADEKAITAMIRREAAEISLQNAQDRRAASQKKLSLADETAIGSIKMLEAELKKLKDTYRSLSETDRNSILGKTMLTQINNADQNLANINAEMANNSALAKTMGTQYNGLRTQISMVARELPNLGISLSTFIISLSNNLPYLADEIAKANKEFNELKKTSQAATPVWKQMIGAIFNWQTALIVGVTVLTAYSREIQAWVGGLLSSKKALDKNIESLDEFQKKVSDGVAGTRATFEALKQGWDDLGNNLEAKNKYIIENQSNFDKLGVSILNVDDATSVFNEHTAEFVKSLDARAKAAAAMDLAAEEYKKAIKKMLEAENAQINAWDNFKSILIRGGLVGAENFDVNLLKEASPEKMMEERKKNIEESAKDAFEESKKLVSKYIQYTEEEQNILESLGIESTNKIVEGSVEAIEASIALKRKALKKLTDPAEYKKAVSEIEKLQKQLEAITGGKKNKIDYNKLKEDALNASKALENAIREGERNIEQAQINLMEEGGEKQLAQIKLNFKKRMDEVSKQTDDYIKLVQEQELKAWKKENPNKKESEFKPQTTSFNTLPKELQDIIVENARLANEEFEKNTQDLVNNLLKKWGDYGDKRAALESETAEKIKQINSVRNLIGDDTANKAIEALKTQLNDAIAALESESLKLTPFYQQLFGDIANYGNSMLQSLIEQTRSIIEQAQNAGKNTKGSYSILVDGEQIELTEGDIARLQKRLGEMDKQMSNNNPFIKLKNAIRDYKYASSDAAKDEAFKNSLQSVSAIAGGTAQVLSSLQDTLKDIGVDSPELEAVFGGLEKTLNGLSSIDITKPFSIITGGLQAIGGLFQTIFNPKQARLKKIIENSRFEVEKLKKSYEDLERVINRQLGQVTEAQAKQQIENLRKQRDELYKQMQAENDKKKTDDSAILDYQKQIKELDDQIQYFYEDLAGEQFGINIKDWAGQIADALTEAFAKGEDAAEAFDDTVASIMKSVFKNVIQLQYIEPAMKKLREYLFGTNGAGGVLGDGDLSSTDMNGLVKELMGFKDKINESQKLWDILNDAAEEAGVSLVEEDKKKKEGLSQSIQGVTEDTANVLGSYLNAIRADVSANRADVSANRVNLQKLVDNAVPFYNDFALHVANLKHLETIAVNTGRNADIVGRIENILTAVTQPGSGRKFNIQ